MQGAAVRRILLVGVAAVVVVAAAFAYLAQDDGVREGSPAAREGSLPARERSPDGVARTAQIEDASLQTSADGREADVTSVDRLPRWVSTRERVMRREALPCTGESEPINFEVFSAGSAVAGAPMTDVVRRCDAGALADESTSNYLAYVYGDCQALTDGCRLPLQVRSYPACQRSYSEYEFEGKPLPYKELPPIEGARVREIEFLVDHRIEVYTGTSTIVISAADWSLAEEALRLLRGQPSGETPSKTAHSLAQDPQQRLEPPVNGAIEGDLPCPV
jgi:hypothetical protein